jgi:hypothetical protein
MIGIDKRLKNWIVSSCQLPSPVTEITIVILCFFCLAFTGCKKDEKASLSPGERAELSSFFRAIEENNLSKVRMALLRHRNWANIGHPIDMFCPPPLHLAANEGHLEIVKLLIDNGADVNGDSIANLTPLHGAALAGHTEVAAFLIEKGAQIDIKSINGKTPLELAREEGHTETVSLLEASASGR